MNLALLQKLDEIEAEMKRIGYWRSDPPAPPPQAVGGKTRSFLDAPSFDRWLQTVFLPNARRSVETDSVPADSQVGLMAMRQYDYHSFVPEAQTLNKLLSEFDGLIRRTHTNSAGG